MNPNVKYTQKVDEKTGEITFVPDTPPQNGNGQGGGKGGQSKQSEDSQQQSNTSGGTKGAEHHKDGDKDGNSDPTKKGKKTTNLKAIIGDGQVVFPAYYLNDIKKEQDRLAEDYFDFTPNHKLEELLGNLEANNKKLRYAKRLQGGKLDGRRLTAYKTSDRLFKKKAIKHKDYQFNILIDTSGSMFHDSLMTAMSAVAKTVKAIESLGMPVAVWSMNLATGLVKDYNEEFNDETFKRNMVIMGGGMIADRQRNTHLSDKEYAAQMEAISTDKTPQSISNTKVRGIERFAGGTIENVAYEQSLAYSKAHSTAKTKPVFIVLSDGEPGGDLNQVPLLIGDKIEYVKMPESGNTVPELRKWWERRSTELTVYGIGIYSSCGQVPNNQTISDLEKLPEVMSDLVQQIIF